MSKRLRLAFATLTCVPPIAPPLCPSVTEELLYLEQFDGLLNCEYVSTPDSCLALSEM